MSVVQACALAEAVIEHARALFAAAPEPVTADGAAAIMDAAKSATAAGERTAGSSGALIAEHASFVARSARTLAAGARSDVALNAQVTTAADLTRMGATELAAIAGETQAISRAAATGDPLMLSGGLPGRP